MEKNELIQCQKIGISALKIKKKKERKKEETVPI